MPAGADKRRAGAAGADLSRESGLCLSVSVMGFLRSLSKLTLLI